MDTECYGIVFCEANVFGLPVITTDIGGVSGSVKDNENVFMLPLDAKAKIIYDSYQDDKSCYKLIKTSRTAFDDRLNWDSWGPNVMIKAT